MTSAAFPSVVLSSVQAEVPRLLLLSLLPATLTLLFTSIVTDVIVSEKDATPLLQLLRFCLWPQILVAFWSVELELEDIVRGACQGVAQK